MSDKENKNSVKADAPTNIVGNCSKCNGPVVSRYFIGGFKVGEYQECLNCGAKRFPSYDKVIPMEIDNPKLAPITEKNKTTTDKIKDDLLKDISDDGYSKNWPSWPSYPTIPYTPQPITPSWPTYPWPYNDPNTTPHNPNWPTYPTTPWITYCYLT